MKKTLYCDMDGVLADFEAELYSRFPEIGKIKKGTKEFADMIDFLCENKGRDMFLTIPLIADAKEAVDLLSEHYDFYILSTPMWKIPESYCDKRIWCERMFGNKIHKRVILSHNKGLLKGDYLIDDRIKNGVDTFEGEHIHFGQVKFGDWKAVLEYLSQKDGWDLQIKLN